MLRLTRYLFIFLISYAVFGCAYFEIRKKWTRPDLPEKGIIPLRFDVSLDNKIYFSYSSERCTAIYSMDMVSGHLVQLTPDSLNCFQPMLSHDNKTILCKCGQVLGGIKNFYLLNTDGSDFRLLLNGDYRLYIRDAVFSRDDQ